jgi:hypothetical protein
VKKPEAEFLMPDFEYGMLLFVLKRLLLMFALPSGLSEWQ